MSKITKLRRLLPALSFSTLATLWLSACGSGGSPIPPIPSSSAAIWFHPLPAAQVWPSGSPNGGSSDFLSLFRSDAPWPNVMAKTKVVGLYAAWIAEATPETLQTVVTSLNANNMAIEIEAPAMQALATCGSGVEGYVPYGQSLHDYTLAYLQRLKALGAQQIFIKVDEPFYFGSVVNDPRSCHFTVGEVASQVGQYVKLVQTVYPNASVGDVEPIIASAYSPDVVTAMTQWHEAFQTVSGAPFPFFFADIDFSNSQWPSLVKSLEVATHQAGMQFGIIYIGDQLDTSDAEWSGKVIARFQAYQGANGGQPDYVLFQSWEPHPQLCLPESDPTTFTGAMKTYIDATS
jgi:hypothetical protein